jgi:hypothetical protein
MDSSHELTRVIADHDRQLAARAAELEREIKQTVRTVRHRWVVLAGTKGLGGARYDPLGDWLAEPGIELTHSQAQTLVEAYRELVVCRGVDPGRLGRADISKVQLARPAVRRKRIEPERAIADAEVLSVRDLKKRYGHAGYDHAVCPKCGSRYRRRVEP